MNYDDFYKIRDLLELKNAYMAQMKRIHDFGKEKQSYTFGKIQKALFEIEEKGELQMCLDDEVSRMIVKHKDELYSLIQKICDEEEVYISKKIDKLDEKLEKYEIINNSVDINNVKC